MMMRSLLKMGFISLFLASASQSPARADDNAATNYLLALLELDFRLSDYVLSATSDDPDHGFASRLSEKQTSFLRQDAVVSALARFDQASTQCECHWSRYTSSSWADAGINGRLHGLARVVLLRAGPLRRG